MSGEWRGRKSQSPCARNEKGGCYFSESYYLNPPFQPLETTGQNKEPLPLELCMSSPEEEERLAAERLVSVLTAFVRASLRHRVQRLERSSKQRPRESNKNQSVLPDSAAGDDEKERTPNLSRTTTREPPPPTPLPAPTHCLPLPHSITHLKQFTSSHPLLPPSSR